MEGSQGEPAPHAWIDPEVLQDGEDLTIRVSACSQFGDRTVQVEVSYVSDRDSGWCLSTGLELDSAGQGSTVVSGGMGLGKEVVLVVTALRDTSTGDSYTFESSRPSALNPANGSLADPELLQQELLRRQRELYDKPLGDPSEPGMVEHRIVVIVEGLLLTQPARFPGWSLVPLPVRPGLEEYRTFINQLVRDLGWAPLDIAQAEPWRQRASSAYPLCAALFPSIWAATYEAAGRIADDSVSRALAVLSANRGATGRPAVVAIQQRQLDDKVLTKLSLPGAQYLGNLAGGFISGEDQTFLLDQMRATDTDPILRLAYELLAEAMRESSTDAQYFRFWSILEFLSGARVKPGLTVTLLDGSPWPDDPRSTTAMAAPRVYEYLRASTTPEQDANAEETLYERVRIWYARRNATGHYGRLIPGDERQMSKGWYPWAIRTLANEGKPFDHLRNLRQTVIEALEREVIAATRGFDESSVRASAAD